VWPSGGGAAYLRGVGRLYDGIDDRLASWLTAQPVFFVASAPLAPDGHVNLSPKGAPGCLVVTGPRRVAYLDLTGSGAETIAHLRENGRITIMCCAFDGPPRIVRLYGRGSVALPGDPLFSELIGLFPARDGTRSIVAVDVERVADSCGYGVPRMTFDAHRDNLQRWAAQKTAAELAAYRAGKNSASIDGLPALP
jgi:hypothetical protein